jgi:hypothetical protein
MPGPRQKRKYVSENPIKKRIRSTAVKGARAVGKSRKAKAFGKAVTTGRAISPFVSAALKAAGSTRKKVAKKGRSNNQHL